MSGGRRGGYGFGISFAGHRLQIVGCCWNQWRFWGIDGNKVEGLGFLKRGGEVRELLLLFANVVVPHGFGL